MTPEAQRIAIAEWMGWTDFVMGNDGRTPWGTPPTGGCNQLPDYLNDLNEMAEAEAKLSDSEFTEYGKRLQFLYLEKSKGRSSLGAISATASERAEALLVSQPITNFHRPPHQAHLR